MKTVKVVTSVQRSKEIAADPVGYLARVRAEAREEARRTEPRAVSDRSCEVWGRHKKWHGRLRDLVTTGHVKHECDRERPFAQEHAGDHACRCGTTYPKTATDNS